jgi:hypothetical protein
MKKGGDRSKESEDRSKESEDRSEESGDRRKESGGRSRITIHACWGYRIIEVYYGFYWGCNKHFTLDRPRKPEEDENHRDHSGS